MWPLLMILLAGSSSAGRESQAIECPSPAIVEVVLSHPNPDGQPRRLDSNGYTVELLVLAYRTASTRGSWAPLPEATAARMAEESMASLPLGSACSRPTGPRPRLDLSLKWGSLGAHVSDCNPSPEDALRVSISCK